MLCVSVLFVSLPSFEPNSSFQMVCSTECASRMRCSVAACHLHRAGSVGASDRPEKHLDPLVHPASAGKPPQLRYPRKATAPPYAATIKFLGREPDPPKSGSSSPPWPGCSTLLRAARVPLQPPSRCSIWSNRRNRGTAETSATGKDVTLLEGSSPSTR